MPQDKDEIRNNSAQEKDEIRNNSAQDKDGIRNNSAQDKDEIRNTNIGRRKEGTNKKKRTMTREENIFALKGKDYPSNA